MWLCATRLAMAESQGILFVLLEIISRGEIGSAVSLVYSAAAFQIGLFTLDSLVPQLLSAPTHESKPDGVWSL